MKRPESSRRGFLKAATAAGAAGVWGATRPTSSEDNGPAKGLPITVAGTGPTA
jgi:hypothetical protein